MPVDEALGVGARRVVEALDDVGGELVVERQAVDVHQAGQAADAGEVLGVHVHPGVGEQPVAGDMVLVAVAVEHGIDGHGGAAPLDDRHRRVDDHRLGAAPHEQRVARRIGPVGVADEHAHRVGQPPLVVTPVDRHPLDGTAHPPRHTDSDAPRSRCAGARLRRTGGGRRRRHAQPDSWRRRPGFTVPIDAPSPSPDAPRDVRAGPRPAGDGLRRPVQHARRHPRRVRHRRVGPRRGDRHRLLRRVPRRRSSSPRSPIAATPGSSCSAAWCSTSSGSC